ncbi:Translation initiation factor eIF-2B subunit epsilon [Cichlidogyrus casuarinus]|uniref:Translation initiation factor eIF-2B subunit epsilon n=1 Tax=Cichlidogyrus casuarinus TaxID=1844966 RepID=A0ABD2PTI9_9PLAT
MKPKNKSNKNEFLLNTEAGSCAVLYTGLNNRVLDPISRYLPECLLPVANVPAIHFVISNLLKDGFKRIIIYACRGAKILEDFIDLQYSQFSGYVEVMQGHCSKSIGDIMRDLDASEIIRNVDDFIFMPADFLCSANLYQMLEDFKKCREAMPNCVMSIAMAQISNHEPTLNSDVVQFVLVRESDHKLIQFHQHIQNVPSKTAKDTVMHQNLTAPGLWFCSKHIPPLFQDNFDYTSGQDLIHGILITEEVINYQIRINILSSDQLHFRMTCDVPRLFDSNRLLLQRKTGITHSIPPLYFDQIDSGSMKLVPGSDYIFVNTKSKISPSARLLGHCLIARDCFVGDNTILINTVLGPGCSIGANCKLRSLICTNNVTIHDNVTADLAFLSAGKGRNN